MGKSAPINAEEQAQVRAALDLLQEAQNLTYNAAQKVCSVHGFGDEWTRICKQGDATKALWHKINNHLSAAAAARAVRS